METLSNLTTLTIKYVSPLRAIPSRGAQEVTWQQVLIPAHNAILVRLSKQTFSQM